ncbi:MULTISPECIES: hypothetical protein [Streptomyces]|uniref:hypothetical protein n=1 Tax=Streptomyces TaxID=1883 RepID=UPI000241AD9E|nr:MULTISPECIES: hypothetical protein [Streptomyces]EHM25681.1 hypothetical protein SPW_5899 [Streptomyces sp. W007]WTD23120.1 hypothetical protein OH737_00575 [Streptomyces anulatus]
MNVSLVADGFTSATAPSTAPMPAVTFDLLTGFIVLAALLLACLVYRWTAPAPGFPVQTSRGERLMYAAGTAASVIVIGSYLAGGFKGFKYDAPTTEKPTAAAGPVLIGQETNPEQLAARGIDWATET